jgi:hypothetical protein
VSEVVVLQQLLSGGGLAAGHPSMGLMSSLLRCHTCGNEQQMTVEAFCDISLSIPAPAPGCGGVALEECLRPKP